MGRYRLAVGHIGITPMVLGTFLTIVPYHLMNDFIFLHDRQLVVRIVMHEEALRKRAKVIVVYHHYTVANPYR